MDAGIAILVGFGIGCLIGWKYKELWDIKKAKKEGTNSNESETKKESRLFRF